MPKTEPSGVSPSGTEPRNAAWRSATAVNIALACSLPTMDFQPSTVSPRSRMTSTPRPSSSYQPSMTGCSTVAGSRSRVPRRKKTTSRPRASPESRMTRSTAGSKRLTTTLEPSTSRTRSSVAPERPSSLTGTRLRAVSSTAGSMAPSCAPEPGGASPRRGSTQMPAGSRRVGCFSSDTLTGIRTGQPIRRRFNRQKAPGSPIQCGDTDPTREADYQDDRIAKRTGNARHW